jgi:hypothetical protein
LRETIGVLREKVPSGSINDIHQKLTMLCSSVSPTETLDVIKENSDDSGIRSTSMILFGDVNVVLNVIRVGSGVRPENSINLIARTRL